MANFEGLIRGALAAKDASSPEVREVVYQSSRNALKRLIEQNRSLTVEAAVKEQQGLEEAIKRIEAEFTAPQPEPIVEEPKVQQHEDPLHELKQILLEDGGDFGQRQTASDATPEAQPVADVQTETVASPVRTEANTREAISPSVEAVSATQTGEIPEISSTDGYENENLPLEFARRRRSQRLFSRLVVGVLVIALVAWGGYYVVSGITNGTLFGFNNNQAAQGNATPTSGSDDGNYITILEPGDLSSLVTADRGRAQIVNELNLEMVRLESVRNDADISQPAKPILMRLKPGVLEQISGKNITFEIYAKSGSSGPAQFMIRCLFGSLGNCGRKRFRVGLQPEASIFAMDISSVSDSAERAFLAFNTDTTEAATTSGSGDVIDIAYIRLRVN